MTTKELSEYFNCSTKTILRRAKEIGVEMKEGRKTYWTKEDVTKIAEVIDRDSATVSVSQSNQAVTIEMLEQIISKTVAETIKGIMPLLQQGNQSSKQIEYTQDYYSIQGYAKVKGVKLSFSDAIRLGKECKTLSDMKCKEVRKVADERFGHVGSYHIDILKEVFEI
jgi:hypothetical protein